MADQIEQAGDDALRSQLMTLEAQREQLASLIGDDPEGPMQQLQEELNAVIAGIRQRLDAQAAATTAKAVSPPPQEVVIPTSHDNASQFAEGDTCLAPRVFDRRRALARLEEMDEARGTCLVTWVHPRHKRELVCRYWKEGRNCKFSGRDCSFSHGIEVPLLELLLPDNYNSSNRGCGQATSTSAVDEAGALSQEPCAIPEAGVGASAGSGGRTSAVERWLVTLDAGSRVLARYHDRVWYDATAEHSAVDGFLAVRFTGFEDEGSVSLPVDLSHLTPPDYDVDDGRERRSGGGVVASPARDDEESEVEDAWANDDGNDGEFFFRERVLGDRREDGSASARVGVGKGAEAGSCLLTDAYVFGDWEQHTKGFGSRMLSRMGYRRGEGLGKEKQGISRPVPIRVLPERRALDHLRVDGGRRPRPQRGPRKHKSKAGSSSSAGNDGGDDGEPQKAMFDLLNVAIHASARDKSASTAAAGSSSFGLARSSLAGRNGPVFDGSSLASRVRGGKTDETVGAVAAAKGGEGSSSSGKSAGNMTRSELRSHLVGAREAESALAAKAARLEQTVARNSERDPQIAAAAKRKLEEVRVQAREVRASMDQAERVLGHRKEKAKGGKGGLFSF